MPSASRQEPHHPVGVILRVHSLTSNAFSSEVSNYISLHVFNHVLLLTFATNYLIKTQVHWVSKHFCENFFFKTCIKMPPLKLMFKCSFFPFLLFYHGIKYRVLLVVSTTIFAILTSLVIIMALIIFRLFGGAHSLKSVMDSGNSLVLSWQLNGNICMTLYDLLNHILKAASICQSVWRGKQC